MTTAKNPMEAIEEAQRLIEEARNAATKPRNIELDGHMSIKYLENGEVSVTVIARPDSLNLPEPEPETKPQAVVPDNDLGFIPPKLSKTARKIEGIINTDAFPNFTGFILPNKDRTMRAGTVLTSFGQPKVNVPGKTIIQWARNEPKRASAVGVALKQEDNSEKVVPLTEFVEEHFPVAVA